MSTKKSIEIVTVRKVGESLSYERNDIKSYFGIDGLGQTHGAAEGERALSHSFLMDTLRKVMGRTLTLIDASISDKEQKKAMKDIVRNIMSDEIDFSAEMSFDQDILQKAADEHFKDVPDDELVDHSVTIEEALGVK